VKVPTLFLRDPGTQRVIDEVRPGCEWVLAEEGVPTRMYDGIGLLYDGRGWWQKALGNTGDEPDYAWVRPSAKVSKCITLGIGHAVTMIIGTYELCGPDIHNNPEGLDEYALIRHAGLPEVPNVPLTYDELRDFMSRWPHEGIVWHHPDGRAAKLRVTDFPR